MKPEDFGIVKYKVLSSGKLDIFQNVDMQNQNLKEFPFEVEKIDGKLNLSRNQLTSLKNIPLNVRDLVINDNKINDISELYKGSKTLNIICLSKNFIKEIDFNHTHFPKLSHFNCLTNNVEKINIKCDDDIFHAGLAINVLQDFSQLPKFIQDLTIGRLTKDNQTHFDRFEELPSIMSQLQCSKLHIENFKGLKNTKLRIHIYECLLDSFKFLPPYSYVSISDSYIKEFIISKNMRIDDLSIHKTIIEKINEISIESFHNDENLKLNRIYTILKNAYDESNDKLKTEQILNKL